MTFEIIWFGKMTKNTINFQFTEAFIVKKIIAILRNQIESRNVESDLAMVVWSCNPNTWEAEAGKIWVCGQSELLIGPVLGEGGREREWDESKLWMGQIFADQMSMIKWKTQVGIFSYQL